MLPILLSIWILSFAFVLFTVYAKNFSVLTRQERHEQNSIRKSIRDSYFLLSGLFLVAPLLGLLAIVAMVHTFLRRR